MTRRDDSFKWYYRFDLSNDTHRDWWAYGKGGERVKWPDGVTDDWLRDNGFATKAAAVRAAGGRDLLSKREWRNRILIEHRDIGDRGLRYKIYRCYEIVILDRDGNEVGNANYCYGTKADAEDMAKHELKLAMMEEGC